MPATVTQKLSKQERACGKKLTEALFCGANSRSFAAFPLRVVYLVQPLLQAENPEKAAAQMMVSVPKRKFKHAVDRNRVKRQLREAFRKNNPLLYDTLPQGQQLTMRFLCRIRCSMMRRRIMSSTAPARMPTFNPAQ